MVEHYEKNTLRVDTKLSMVIAEGFTIKAKPNHRTKFPPKSNTGLHTPPSRRLLLCASDANYTHHFVVVSAAPSGSMQACVSF